MLLCGVSCWTHPSRIHVLWVVRCTDLSCVGCYMDSIINAIGTPYNRPLFYITENNVMTIELCKQMARDQGFAYAAVQYFGQCFGGNNISSYTTAGNCDTRCNGNSNEWCGGALVNGIYRTSK